MKKILLLGSGELGKEFAISAKRAGCFVTACDKYDNAPAMQVADRKIILNMLDRQSLIKAIEETAPDFIVPEIEAIKTDELIQMEKKGFKVIPSARAVNLTMNRDQIRNRAVELGIKTASFAYASSLDELETAVKKIGVPCIVKPVMSSSGKGQIKLSKEADFARAWEYANTNKRGDRVKLIIEEFIDFNYEITLLTVKQKNNETLFCQPIGHTQEDGDYKESWQPIDVELKLLEDAKKIAKLVTDDLGGEGIFGVEFFINDKQIIFSELSPRPHDTGLVTLYTQNLNEFDLHLRAILHLPIPKISILRKGYSAVIKAGKDIDADSEYEILGIDEALKIEDIDIKLFGKPSAYPGRRLGIILAPDKEKGKAAKSLIRVLKKNERVYT